MKTILKKAKRTLSLLLVLLTVYSCLPMFASADGSISIEGLLPFEDVANGKWYTEGVTFCYVNGVVTGVTDYTFEPGTALTRGMFVVMLAGAVDADVSAYSGSSSFKDVKTTSWYANAVEWAYQNGYVSGIGEGYFSPKTNITRQQMGVLLMAYMQANGYDISVNKNILNKFTDANTISSWAKDGVLYTVSAGLMNGTTDTLISPKTELTRAQATTILMQFLKNYHYGETCLHNNMIDSTCTESAHCADCGMKIGLPDGHHCSSLSCVKSSKCNECGETVYASSGQHDFAAATCTKARTCRDCGLVRGSAIGHKYSAATCTTPKTCTVCKITSGAALGHKYSGTTCTTDGKCSRCGGVQKAFGHYIASANCTQPSRCTRCTLTAGAPLGHNYVGTTCTANGKCSRCSAVQSAYGHNYSGTTCTTNGRCTRCSAIQKAYGHSMSNGYCTRCGQGETLSQKNALAEAKTYLKYSAFSRQRLIEQLEYEGYPYADAVYAVDNCGANWYEQALKDAKSYLRSSSFSYKGLLDQLEYEKYTYDQAVYAVNNCGANWYEQAAKTAKTYLKYSSFSRQRLIEQLEYEGFTHDQAIYGVTAVGY